MMHLNSFLAPIVSLRVPSSLSVVLYHPSSYFQRNNTLLFFWVVFFFSFFSCLDGSLLPSIVCGGSAERHLTGPSTDSRYTPQLRL